MQSHAVELLGFPDDDALHDVLTKFNILANYRAFLPDHLAGVLREQHQNVQIRTIEFLNAGECKLGGFPSPDNSEHLLVDSLTAPLDLRLRLSTNEAELHELDITLEINATNLRELPQIATNMFVRNHNVI